VVENLVESKIVLLAQSIVELLENDDNKLYLYPWLDQLYARHHNKVPQDISDKLQKICIV
jgi:hypothetical protein